MNLLHFSFFFPKNGFLLARPRLCRHYGRTSLSFSFSFSSLYENRSDWQSLFRTPLLCYFPKPASLPLNFCHLHFFSSHSLIKNYLVFLISPELFSMWAVRHFDRTPDTSEARLVLKPPPGSPHLFPVSNSSNCNYPRLQASISVAWNLNPLGITEKFYWSASRIGSPIACVTVRLFNHL